MSNIRIEVLTEYLPEQSEPANGQYVYTYTILIHNEGNTAAQLISRHWIITDSNNATQEVQGLGVVGEQPRILPGECYQYTSGVVMQTATGMMTGNYNMQYDDGSKFQAEIPKFALVQPHAVH
ncbi:MAG: Co2+/Mg2+ efflux protein ApaG [Agarilytica sp.]